MPRSQTNMYVHRHKEMTGSQGRAAWRCGPRPPGCLKKPTKRNMQLINAEQNAYQTRRCRNEPRGGLTRSRLSRAVHLMDYVGQCRIERGRWGLQFKCSGAQTGRQVPGVREARDGHPLDCKLWASLECGSVP
jgi:hypothetical protein